MICSPEHFDDVRREHAAQSIALVHGVFDIVHPGHVRHLEAAKTLADVVVVAVCGDEQVRARKGPERPINTAHDRAAVINAFRAVDYTFVLNEIGWPDEVMLPHLPVLQPDYYLLSSKKRQQPFGDKTSMTHASGRTTELVYDEMYYKSVYSTTGIVARVVGK